MRKWKYKYIGFKHWSQDIIFPRRKDQAHDTGDESEWGHDLSTDISNNESSDSDCSSWNNYNI